MNPRQLDLPMLKAFVARMSIAIALEAGPLPEADEESKSVQTGILKALYSVADQLQNQKSGRLDEELAKLAVPKANDIGAEGVAFDDLRARVGRLSEDLTRINCLTCAKFKNRICNGATANDRQIVSTRGHCIGKLHALLKFITDRTRLIYAEAADRLPPVTLSTLSTREHADHELLKEFDVGGRCEILDDAARSAVVAVIIKERRFDWDALCGLPYILTHEVVCHAFQDLHSGRREAADEKCPWSEGWMDRLAYALTHHWRTGQGNARFPPWLDTINVGAQTDRIHRWRYDPASRGTSLPPEQADALDSARRTFDQVQELWGRAPVHRHRIAKFSARLNACAASNETREDIVIVLQGLLRQGTAGLRSELAIGYCADFVDDGDFAALLNKLKKLVETPIAALRPRT